MSSSPFAESSPASDADPYETSTSQPRFDIDRNKLPKPVPLIAPLLGYDDKFFAKVTRLKIERAAAHLKRPLTSDEVNAMAYFGAKQIQIVSYSTPMGVAGGAWRCWDTRKKFRFPFWGPNMETFKPNQFPNGTVFYEGPQARQLWHLFRALFYMGFGKFAAGMLLGSYAMSVAAVGEMSDPRLRALQETFQKEALNQRARQADIRNGMQGVSKSPSDNTGPMSQPGGEGNERPYDDASPSSGMYFDEMSEAGKPTIASAGGVAEQGQPEAQSPYSRFKQFSQKSQAVPPPQQEQVQENDSSSFMGLDDDASPTGGQGMSMDNSASAQAGASAWDRVRSGQRPVSSRAKPAEQSQNQDRQLPARSSWSERRGASQNADSADSFTASNAQESRRYSREEAQKEFDAKIERERRGGDFSGGNGDQRRW